LSDEEIRLFWAATGEEGYPWQPIQRLLLLTAQRKSDVLNASWPEFDFDKKLWTIPASRYKGGGIDGEDDQLVPLTDQTIAILKGLPRFKYPEGEFIFSFHNGKTPVKSFSKPARRLEARMGVSDWVIHDLRRSVRTRLSGLPIEEHVRELMIGHSRKGIARVYDQWEYIDELRHGFELWQQRLSSILNPTPDKVVNIGVRQRK
jgi:integrase